jgi:hypothetical protein
MNTKILYVIAAVLALTAATIYFVRAAPGEDVTLRVALLAVLGLAMLWLGLRRSAAP